MHLDGDLDTALYSSNLHDCVHIQVTSAHVDVCFVGFIQIAITTIANLSSCVEDSGQFFDVDQV